MKTALPSQFQPKLVTITLPDGSDDLINAVQSELTRFAKKDANQCWGYFPALKEKNQGLEASKKLSQELSVIEQGGKQLSLNFARISLIQQTGDSPFHMDSDSKTALTGDVDSINSRLVWRLLINLHPGQSRTLGYLDLDVSKLTLTTDGGYIHYTGDTTKYERGIVIPARQGSVVQGVLFCASRVLHTGKDSEEGHFVAGYGCEEAAD